ncbi:MAG: DUF962 domain-containing protein [Candidatus Ancaeobacter aquaticus]|nr:DUF962 domain-containing protein [Candidatus Ancaeobacter aquaticus]
MDLKKGIEIWCSRHKHPINAVLHAIGIPLTFVAGIIAMKVSVLLGVLIFILGYVLQYVGHNIEKNEMGELILIKKLFSKKK